MTRHKTWTRVLGRIVLGLFCLQSILIPSLAPMTSAWAQAVPAANAAAGQRAIMDAAANGVPIAHIAPPTAAGVSRNQYGQFNVGTNGLILNNSTGNVQTQLGGWITGNPQLGTPARVIVNEVIGTGSGNASSLRGTMEVAGSRANVIVANPNGISCDGCGFLNTGRGTLSTGTLQYGADGRVSGFNVTQGSLAIGSAGLNAANVEQLDLIARGLVVEGEVWAKNLRVLLGANQVLYDTVQATPQAGTGAAPAFAVDIKNLGGMYADQVYLVATEKGLGVNSTGRLAALQGSLVLSAAGDLSLKDSYAKGDLQLSSAGAMALTGATQTDAAARLQAGGAFGNSGTLDAAGQVAIDAASVGNSGAINARAVGADALNVNTSGTATNTGSLYSAGDLNVAAGQWQGRGDTVQSGGNMTLTAGALSLQGSQLTSNLNATLNATGGDLITSGARLTTQGQLTALATGQASNTGGAWQAGQGIAVNVSALDNTAGTLLAAGRLTVAARGQVDNTGGQLLGGAGVNLTAASLTNAARGNQQAQIASDQAVTIQLTGSSTELNNQGGLISAKTDLAIDTAGGALRNANGVLVANNGLTVRSENLDNTQGAIVSSAGAARIDAASVVNDAGQISAAQSLTLNASALSNRSGLIVATGDTALQTSGPVDNTQGAIASIGGALTVNTQGQTLTNAGGKLQALGNVTVTSGALSSRSGLISGQDVTLVTGAPSTGSGGAPSTGSVVTLDNQAGQIVAAGTLAITGGKLNNDAGLIQSDGNARIDTQGQALVNAHAGAAGGILAGGTLTVLAGSLDNQAGYLASNGDLSVTTTGRLDNRRTAGVPAGPGVPAIPSVAGQITSGASVTLAAGEVLNAGSSITAVGNLGVTAQTSIANQGGTLNANGDTTLTTLTTLATAGVTLDNSSAGLIGGKNITATASRIGNQGGSVRAANNATLTASTALDNTGGLLSAKGDLAVSAPAFANAGGTAVGDRSVSLATASDRFGGTLASAGDIGLTINGDYTNTGNLTPQGNLTVSAANITNSGVLHADKVLNANASADITNSGEMSGQTTVLSAGGTFTNTGTGLVDGTNTRVTAQTVDNTGRIYGDDLRISADTVNNSTTGVIAARNNLAVAAQNLNNTDGALIYALGNIAIGGAMDANGNVTGSATNVVNRAATIEAGRDLAISAANIKNLNGGYTTRVVEVDRKQVQQYQSDGGGPIWTDYDFFAYGKVAPCNPTGTDPYSYMRNSWNPYACGTPSIIGYNKLNPAAWGSREYANPVTSTTVSSADYAKWGVAPPAPAADGSPAAQAAAATALSAAVAAVNTAITAYNQGVESDYAMTGCCHYYDFQYTQVQSETQLATTQPGKLLSGGNMTLQGTTLNDASTIAAGASLVIVGPAVRNVGVAGVRQTDTENGQVRYVGRSNPGGWNPYTQAPVVETFDVPAFVYLENTNQTTGYSAGRSGTAADALAAGTNTNVSAASFAPPTITRVTVPGTTANPASVILTTLPSLRAPSNSLFTLHPQPGARYLVETDPRFTNKRTFLGSDYLLQQLNADPSRSLKRYGDGFFEQQQINDQILALTGRRYLADYSDTETEYKALMDGGIAFARAYQLTPGVALTAEQMALLTTDIVWLTAQTVTLPDGSTQQVLVPQVYLRRAQGGDLQQSGALITGADVYIKTTGDIVNSGQIEGTRSSILVAGNDILNTGTLRGGAVVASAARDLQNLGGSILGIGDDSTVSLMAGRDIVLRTTTQSTAVDYGNGRATQTNIDRIATVQGGNVSLQAGGNILAEGAQVAATGNAAQGGGQLSVNAQGDIRITGVQTSQQSSVNVTGSNASGSIERSSTSNVASNFASAGDQQIAAGGQLDIKGSNLASGGSMALSGSSVSIEAARDRTSSDVRANQSDGTRSRGAQMDETLSGGTITAGNNLTIVANGKNPGEGTITATGAQINAGGAATLIARNDVTLQNATTEHSSLTESHSERSGWLSSSSSTANGSSRSTQVEGTTLGAGTISISSGNDPSTSSGGTINVIGSNVVSDRGTALVARNNVNIVAAQGSYEESNFTQTNESGLMSSGGLGFTIGRREQSGNGTASGTTASGSTVGAIDGNVTIRAGNQYTQIGSDVIAPGGDIDIRARSVAITEARETSQSQSEQRASQSGLTVSLTNPVVSAVQTIQGVAQAASQTSDGRMQALAAATGALAIKNASDAVGKNPTQAGGVNLNLSLGSSHNQSSSQSASNTAAGSRIAAGGNVQIMATGGGTDSNPSTGSGGTILIQGSTVSAGGNVSLQADNQVNLLAARNDFSQSSNSSSGAGSIGFSAGTNGMAVSANASRGRGNSNGVDQTYTQTTVQAGNTLRIQSGGDTNMVAASVSGERITANIGGNLNIASVQDISTDTANDRNAGFGVSIPVGPGTGAGFGLSANVGRTNIDSDFRSVTEQSGIRAGNGGFDVVVAGNTDLQGAVITSTDAAASLGRNRLVTGSLTTSDLQNTANYSADSMSLGGGYTVGGSSVGTNAAGNAQVGGLQTPGSTLPGLNGFSATAPVAMSASASSSSTTRSGISSASIVITNEADQRARTGQDAAATVASINTDVSTGRDTSNALAPIFNEREIRAGFAITQALVQETSTFLDNRAREADVKRLERDAAVARGDSNAARALDAELADLQQWAPSGTYRQVTTALVGALSGNVTGSTGQVLQGAAVNYFQGLGAAQVAQLADNLGSETARAALQGLLACAGAAAQGANCAAAATGAAASVVLNAMLGDTDGLTAEQREARRNIVSSLVGALASQGGDVSAAVTAANIETENNALSLRGSVRLADTLRGCWGKGNTCSLDSLRSTLTADADRQAERISTACAVGGNVTQCMALASTANTTAMNLLNVAVTYADTPEKQQLVSELLARQVADMDALYASLQNQSAAAGVLDMLGAAIGQTIQVAGMSGMVVRGRNANEIATSQGTANSANGARLNMQLAAEQAAGANAPRQITSYSNHANIQMSTRDGGIGVNQSAVNDAFLNPVSIQYVPSQFGPTFRYVGQNATVVVNAQGNVVTTWATTRQGIAR